jgi:hypothetical protein
MPCRVGFPGRSDGTPVDLSPGVVHEFVNPEGLKVGSSQSVTKAALLLLQREWPADLPFAELAARAVGIVREAGVPVDDEARARVELAADLLECLVSGAGIDLRTEDPRTVTKIAARPHVSATARAQARRHAFATNARHQRVDLDATAIAVIGVCDGEHDHAAMIEHLVGLVHAGKLPVEREGEGELDDDKVRAALRPVLDRTLGLLARYGLLEA